MNLTFQLDSHPAGTYQHLGTASASGFLPSQPVFAKTDLAEAPHNLTIQVGPDSVLLLDYIVYTQGVLDDGTDSLSSMPFSTPSDAPGAQETGSGTGSSAPSAGPRNFKVVRIIPAIISGRYNSLTRRIILFAGGSAYLTGS